jgi:SAM-dependent methyltransferase
MTAKPYHATVIDILKRQRAHRVLDAPTGEGWLGPALGRAIPGTRVDGVWLWEQPPVGSGYGELIEHDLDQPLAAARRGYDAVVCAEAIHLFTNPGVALDSFARSLRPGGVLIITTPNTWFMRSRLQFLLRGFHSGFRPMLGKRRSDYVAYLPWSFPQLHLFLTHYGFGDIALHEVEEPKPKRRAEYVLAIPSRMYGRHCLNQACDAEEQRYWKQAVSHQSLYGRWLVVSATAPPARVNAAGQGPAVLSAPATPA